MSSLLRNPYARVILCVLIALALTLIIVERPVKVEARIAERLATLGKDPPTHWLVPVWIWKALVVDTGLALLLLVLTPLAGRPVTPQPYPPRPLLGRLNQGLIALAGAVFLFHAGPRLTQSLWGDEEYTMRKLIAPRAERLDNGTLSLTPTPWTETLWEFERPTNHIGYTVVARLLHDSFFTPGPGPQDPWFSEFWVRLPVLLAGLASILSLVWCARVWGWTRGIGWIALAYASHSWLVRFGSDARGYGFVMMLVPLLIGSLGRAVQTRTWRWWLTFGFIQFYLIWTHVGSVLLVVAVNASAVVLLLADKDRWALLGRLCAVGLAGGMLFFTLFAPCLPPFLAFMDRNELHGPLDAPWFTDAAASLYAGLPWHTWEPGNPHSLAITTHPIPSSLGITFLILGAIATVVGLARLAFSPSHRALLILFVGGPTLMIAQLLASETRPYHWYLNLFVPLVFLLWAAAWQSRPPTTFTGPVTAITGGALAGVFLLAWTPNRHLALFPVEPCRESVALTRSITNATHPDFGNEALTAGPGMTTEGYDPATLRLQSVGDLRELMTQSDRQQRPLFLNFGFRSLLAQTSPELFELIDNPNLFEMVAVLPGQFMASTRHVYRYRSGSAKTLP